MYIYIFLTSVSIEVICIFHLVIDFDHILLTKVIHEHKSLAIYANSNLDDEYKKIGQ